MRLIYILGLVLFATTIQSQIIPPYYLKADTSEGLILRVGPDSVLYYNHPDSLGISGGSTTPGGGDKAIQFDSLNNFHGDEGKFKWDYTNNRLQIGSGGTADKPLTVFGDVRFDDDLYDSGNVAGDTLDVLTSYGVTKGFHWKDITTFPDWGGYWTKLGNDVYYNTGDVTVGNTTPGTAIFNVYGTVAGTLIEARSSVTGEAWIEYRNLGQRYLTGISSTSDWVVFDNTAPTGYRIVVDSATGNFGIKTQAPTSDLHVEGDTRLNGDLYDKDNGVGNVKMILGQKAADAGAPKWMYAEDHLSYVRVKNNTSTSNNWNNSTLIDITDLGTKDYEEGDETWTVSSSNVTLPVTGKYRVQGTFYLEATGDLQILIYIYTNGSEATGAIPTAVHFSGSLRENTVVIDQVIEGTATHTLDIRAIQNGAAGTVDLVGTNDGAYTVTLLSRD